MGKKSATEATNLFSGLEDLDVKASKMDELGYPTEKTVTRNVKASALKEEAPNANKKPQSPPAQGQAPRPPGLNVKKRPVKKGFEDIDPMLEQMLVHPEKTGVTQGLEATEGGTSGTNTETSSQLNLVKGEKSVVAHIVEETTPVPEELVVEDHNRMRDDDKTQKIQSIKAVEVPDSTSRVPMPAAPVSGLGLEEQLRSANYLELAQNRVLELEKEVQKLRRDNEQLSSAGQHFKELTETIKQQLRQSEANFFNLKEIAEEEKKILTQSLEAKEIKIGALQERLIELEEKINSSFDHVRIRERELENRLEIMKTESDAVMSSKDEMILDLKKQLNLVNSDLEKYRIQNQKIASKMEGKEELLRRTVKALRIALTMLEGSRPDDDN